MSASSEFRIVPVTCEINPNEAVPRTMASFSVTSKNENHDAELRVFHSERRSTHHQRKAGHEENRAANVAKRKSARR